MFKKSLIFTVLDLFLPYFAVLTFVMLLIESFTFVGVLNQFIFVNSRMLFYGFVGLLTLMTIWLVMYPKTRVTDATLSFLRWQSLFVLPLTILYYIFYLLERQNFPNFVYSNYHVQPQNFQYVLLMGIWTTLFWFIVLLRDKIEIKNIFQSLFESTIQVGAKTKPMSATFLSFRVILLVLLIAVGINNGVNTMVLAFSSLSYIVTNPWLNHDQKMQYNWQGFYVHMMFVKQITPPTATIAIPPAQSHWLTDGNSVIVRYFLYPRRVVNLVETELDPSTLYKLPAEHYDYVLLTKGNWPDGKIEYGWPKIPFPAKAVYYLNPDQAATRSAVKFFDPSLEINSTSNGLIEI